VSFRNSLVSTTESELKDGGKKRTRRLSDRLNQSMQPAKERGSELKARKLVDIEPNIPGGI